MADRREQASVRQSGVNPWLLGAAAAGAAIGLGSLALAYYSTHPPRFRPRTGRRDRDLPVEPVEFASRDGVRLAGWFIPAEGAHGGIVLCHGHMCTRAQMLTWARMLHPAGFHLLMFDLRHHGQSGGESCSIGQHEVGDLLGAVDYLVARPEMAGLRLGVVGLSLGGALAVMAAAQDNRISAVATHGAFATLDGAITRRCWLVGGPAGPAVDRCSRWWARRWLPGDTRLVAPVEVVGCIAPRPLLIQHGAWDLLVSPGDARLLHQAAGPGARLVMLPRSYHSVIGGRDLPAYRERLVGFFEQHLAQPVALP